MALAWDEADHEYTKLTHWAAETSWNHGTIKICIGFGNLLCRVRMLIRPLVLCLPTASSARSSLPARRKQTDCAVLLLYKKLESHRAATQEHSGNVTDRQSWQSNPFAILVLFTKRHAGLTELLLQLLVLHNEYRKLTHWAAEKRNTSQPPRFREPSSHPLRPFSQRPHLLPTKET